MATATKQAHAAKPASADARDASLSASLKFVCQGDRGDYRSQLARERSPRAA